MICGLICLWLFSEALKCNHLKEVFSKLHSIAQDFTSAGIYLEIYTLSYIYSCDGSKASNWPFFSLLFIFLKIMSYWENSDYEPGKTRKAEMPNHWPQLSCDAGRLWSVEKILMFYYCVVVFCCSFCFKFIVILATCQKPGTASLQLVQNTCHCASWLTKKWAFPARISGVLCLFQ